MVSVRNLLKMYKKAVVSYFERLGEIESLKKL